MRITKGLTGQKVGGAIGVILVLLAGWILLRGHFPLAESLKRVSYDWLFDFALFSRPGVKDSEVVLVYLDEDSQKKLGQPLNVPWDRALHAKLLNRLTAEGARAVVFDIIFSDPGPNPESDDAFAEEIRKNGKVILAADYVYTGTDSGPMASAMWSVTPPCDHFLTNAATYGLAMLEMEKDQDFTVRKHFTWLPERNLPSLSWATARFLGLEIAANPEEAYRERWINYYGGPETLPHVGYAQVLNGESSPGFFRNKVVLVGARPPTGPLMQRRDELRSPASPVGGQYVFMPSVEVHATEILNLIRKDWLTRLSSPARNFPLAEFSVFFCGAVFFGFGLFRFRPVTAILVAFIGVLLTLLFALILFDCANAWFPWLLIAAVQMPVGLLWCIVFKSIDWYVQRRKLEQERKRADMQIREQAALLDKAQDAIIVHDLDWNASFWNKSAERIYGWTAPEVLKENLTHFILNGDAAKLAEAKQTVLRTGEWIGELNQKTKSGAHITVQSRWSLVSDSEGNPASVLVINTDMTEKKKLEAQFLRAQRMESIGTLAGGIAHDLNNVLSPIVMGVELLQMKTPDEQSQKLLKTMSASARRGADMVKQVLTFARGHDGERSPLQFTHLVKEMQKIVRETFPKSIEITTEIGESLWSVLGDATQWHQVLLNLCVNARDAMPEGGEITIRAENVTFTETDAKRLLGAKPINYVALSVSDNGTGIPQEIRDKIFEPFFTTKEIGKGTGLGLSTVISIIKNHNAVLELLSEVGKGTTFRIYIPAIQAAAITQEISVSPAQLRGRGELLLLVDDEPAVLDVIKATLNANGYRVLTACHGADAIAVTSRHAEAFAAVLVDIMMPVMDGSKAINALRQSRPDLPIIAMSGLQQNDSTREDFKAKGIPFLAKPVNTEKLLLALHELLRVAEPLNTKKRETVSEAAN